MDQAAETGDLSRAASSEEEFDARAYKFLQSDPFPSVPPALLSTAEILDYDRVTGMSGILDGIKDEHLKAASLEIFIGGEYVYWSGKKKIKKTLTKDDVFLKLPANSIVFVQTSNSFRLPEYIAMRFNLRITHVHRGLLLGTGPLVDPGFRGRLLIPLHNLTSSDYLLDTRKALIWAEFTKTSAHFERLSPQAASLVNLTGGKRPVNSIENYKKNVPPDEYLFKAGGGYPIASSIPSAVRSARRDAKQAQEATEKVQAWARGFGLLAVLGAVLGIAGIVNTTWSLVHTAGTAASNAEKGIVRLEGKVDSGSVAGARITRQLEQATEATANLERRLGASERQVDELRTKLATAESAAVDAMTRVRALEGRLDVLTERVATTRTAPSRAAEPRRRTVRRGRAGAGR